LCWQELAFIEKINDHEYRIKPGFVPHMLVPGTFFVNDRLSQLVFDELEAAAGEGGVGGFLPAVRQVANVAALPGIVGVSLCCARHALSKSSHTVVSVIMGNPLFLQQYCVDVYVCG
jgi:hypothetical protein